MKTQHSGRMAVKTGVKAGALTVNHSAVAVKTGP